MTHYVPTSFLQSLIVIAALAVISVYERVRRSSPATAGPRHANFPKQL